MSEFKIGNVFKGALAGGLGAGVVNLGVYALGSALGAKYLVLPPDATQLEVVSMERCFLPSVVFALLAATVFAGLLKVTPAKAWKVFLCLAAVVYVLMIPGPFIAIVDDLTASIAFEVMHLVASAGIVLGIGKFGRG